MRKCVCLTVAFTLVMNVADRVHAVEGSTLDIGPASGTNGDNTISGTNSGALGIFHQVSGAYSFSIGWENIVPLQRSLVIGYNNGFNSTDLGGVSSLIVGGSNAVESYATINQSLIAGFCNLSSSADCDIYQSIIGGYMNTSTENGSVNNSAVFGTFNNVSISDGLVVGYNNVARGTSYVLGRGLTTGNNSMAVMGSYNSTPASGQVFAIGIGTGNSSDPSEVYRANALEIYNDGKILMAPQGDIVMGEFGE